MSKPARRFLVGYKGARQVTVWGRRYHLSTCDTEYRIDDFCELMTKTEARKAQKRMDCGIIYEIMPIQP